MPDPVNSRPDGWGTVSLYYENVAESSVKETPAILPLNTTPLAATPVTDEEKSSERRRSQDRRKANRRTNTLAYIYDTRSTQDRRKPERRQPLSQASENRSDSQVGINITV